MKTASIEELYRIFLQFPIITTDSRNCPEGSIFFALKGESFNGNGFALAALEKGCRFAVIDEKQYCIDERFILVADCLLALQLLAKRHRQTLKTPIIGITGTNGKTTTKELIAAVLSQKYNTLYTQGNLNNHIGVPLTLLGLTAQHQMAVIEMGANHLGEIKTLAEIACPDFGIITNVGKAHLEGFGSFEGVIQTKSELYTYIQNTNGKIFINCGNRILMEKAANFEKMTYSLTDEAAFVSGEVTSNHPYVSMEWKEKGGKPYAVDSQLIGAYNAENILAAICIGRYFGVEEDKVCAAIKNYVPQNNRSQLTKTANNDLIVDAYNANPTSMQAAVRNFIQIPTEPKALILGDMLELGKDSEQEHAAIVAILTEAGFDKVFLVGENFRAVAGIFSCYQSVDTLNAELKAHPLKGYTILIKGSRGTRLEKVIEHL